MRDLKKISRTPGFVNQYRFNASIPFSSFLSLDKIFVPAQRDDVKPDERKANADPLMHAETQKNFGGQACKFDNKARKGHQNEIQAKSHTGP